MFGSTVLEIALGLIFVYFVLSLVCSALSEVASAIVHLRAKTLEEGIKQLLANEQVAQEFFAHPLVRGLCRDGKKPSYIPTRIFATVLMELRERPNLAPHLQSLLGMLSQVAGQSLKRVRGEIERWFDDAMERVSGWYQRTAQLILWVLALSVTAVLNADTIEIVNTLAREPTVRAAVVAAAEAAAESGEPLDAEAWRESVDRANNLASFGLPIGWSDRVTPGSPGGWILKLIGLLVTAAAVSLGAPFWFDLLKKVADVRGAGRSAGTGTATAEASTA